MMNPSMLPLGFTFSPTDEELFRHYLYHKIVSEHIPPFLMPLPVIDLYIHEPSLIWQQLGGIDGQDLYFFTMLKKKKSRIVRKVGSNGGTWSGENKAIKVFSSANDHALIGTIKRFHFENPKLKVNNDDCSWIMYEYTLDPTLAPKGIAHDSYVLCMIRKRNVISAATKRMYTFLPTTTSMEVYGQNPKQVEVVDRENQSCIDMNNMGLTKDEINMFDLHFNHLKSAELEKNIPPFDNQPTAADMSPTTQMEYEDQNLEDVFAKELEGMLDECNN